jgi:hypothetical protein
VGDSLESVTIVAWNVHQFFKDPLRLFAANVLFPIPDALAFTDHRLLPSLVVAPVIWTTGNAVLATNLATFAACVFAAMAARHAALRLGLDALAAWTVGALYGFHSYQINEGPRLNIVSHGFLPLALLSLVELLKTGERRHAWWLAAWMLLQGLASNYHLLYAALVVAIVLAGFALRAPGLALRRLATLASRHGSGARGAARLRLLAAALMDVTETRMRRVLAALPRGRWRAEDLLDDDGRGTCDVRIAVTLTLGGGRARVDLTRSAPQTDGPVNAVPAVTRAAVAYVVLCVVGEMPVVEPGPGEVRVALRTSGVNPSDVKARGGSRPMLASPRQRKSPPACRCRLRENTAVTRAVAWR